MSQRPAANRMTLQTFKSKLLGAKKGHKLLKQKRDALKARFSALLKEIVQTKMDVGQGLKDAAFSQARAQWANAGEDMTTAVLEKCQKPSITTSLTAENVAGVKLPMFKLKHDPTKDTIVQTLGVAHGGAVINNCRETYFQAVNNLIKLASLQTAFIALDEEIKMTSRRVNALEYVLIPQIEEVVAYIIQEIDEQARDEFTRVKKVVEKKRQKKEKEWEAREKERLLEEGEVEALPKAVPAEPAAAPAESAAAKVAAAAAAPAKVERSPAAAPADVASKPAMAPVQSAPAKAALAQAVPAELAVSPAKAAAAPANVGTPSAAAPVNVAKLPAVAVAQTHSSEVGSDMFDFDKLSPREEGSALPSSSPAEQGGGKQKGGRKSGRKGRGGGGKGGGAAASALDSNRDGDVVF